MAGQSCRLCRPLRRSNPTMSEAFSILFSTLTGKQGRLSRSLGSVTVPVPSTRIARTATIADVDLLLSKQKIYISRFTVAT